jgi:hypothetical protein
LAFVPDEHRDIRVGGGMAKKDFDLWMGGRTQRTRDLGKIVLGVLNADDDRELDLGGQGVFLSCLTVDAHSDLPEVKHSTFQPLLQLDLVFRFKPDDGVLQMQNMPSRH